MSTALDVYALTDEQVRDLTAIDDIEDLDAEPLTLSGFTNFEIEDLAQWLNVRATEGDPIVYDEDSGLVIFAWQPDFGEALAKLSTDEIRDFADRLKQHEELKDVERTTIIDNLKKLSSFCVNSRNASLQIIQIAAF